MEFVFMTACSDNTSFEEKKILDGAKLIVPKKEIVLAKDFTQKEKELFGFFG